MEMSKCRELASRLVTAWVSTEHPELLNKPPTYTRGWIENEHFHCAASIDDTYVIGLDIYQEEAVLDIDRYEHSKIPHHIDTFKVLFPESC